MVVERCAHYLHARGRRVLTLLGVLPVLEIALHDVDHVADKVTDLPARAASHHVPVLRIRDQLGELLTVSTHHGEDGRLGVAGERADGGDYRGAHALPS